MIERKPVTEERLDRLLRQYSDIEPAPGLEDRIISGILSERARARTRRVRWSAAGMAAALLISLLYLPWALQRAVPPEQERPQTEMTSLTPVPENDFPAPVEELAAPLSGTDTPPAALVTPAIEKPRQAKEAGDTVQRQVTVVRPDQTDPEAPPEVETEGLVQSLSIQELAISELAVAPLEAAGDSSANGSDEGGV